MIKLKQYGSLLVGSLKGLNALLNEHILSDTMAVSAS